MSDPEPMTIAVRAYARRAKVAQPRRPPPPRTPSPGPSAFTLVFDTETTVDAAQQLRVGAYQWRRHGELREAGLFYDPASLRPGERRVVKAYAREHGLVLRTDREFVDDVFYAMAYELNATIVGFNLPFDLSRLAISHNPARGKMHGGFTLKLSENPMHPNVRVRHLNARSAFIRFAGRKQPRTSRSARRRGRPPVARPGYFVDVKTGAAAVIGGSHTLRSLAVLLETPTKKLDMDDYAGEITPTFLDYAVADPQVTWECYTEIARRYAGFGLSTPLSSIYSEASVGKACLREMGIQGWQKMQPDFPPELLGIVLSTYFGGRSEVKERRRICQVLYCDFHATYPSICVLTGIWRFVIAAGIDHHDATAETIRLLDGITLDQLQDRALWSRLAVLVQVLPKDDVFPVRAEYGKESSFTIGLNRLSADRPVWYTLADVIASKLITHKAPKVLRAIRFEPREPQEGLRPIDVLGQPAFRIDPVTDDFYRRLVDLRSQTRRHQREAAAAHDLEADRLDAAQKALKTTASATSYGIFVELNVDHHDRLQELSCFGTDGEAFPAWEHNLETPGSFFHPVLATLITGAARLLLAIAEALTVREGIGWAFCDTDSMALARPDGMDEADFLTRALRIQSWFDPLNPYEETSESLFEIEDANHALVRGRLTDELAPLWCLAVSAKRVCLFNIDGRGRPRLRKASAHGLGHLRPPYDEDHAPKAIPKPVVSLKDLDVERWEHDLWYRIVQAALGKHPEQVRTADLEAFDAPAVARYAATTPGLLRWFTRFNAGKPYREQVRPFGFMLAFQVDPTKLVDEAVPRVVAPYDPDPTVAARSACDRETGEPVNPDVLKTYRRSLGQHHLHPEAKFAHADYLDTEPTERRHIRVVAITHIGKEANRWEEQFYLGQDPEAQVNYGMSQSESAGLRAMTLRACEPFGVRAIAKMADLSTSTVSDFIRGRGKTTPETMASILAALAANSRG